MLKSHKDGENGEEKNNEYFKSLKDTPHRKPLILQGARQLGKTYSLLEFGRTCYENVAYFNFESTPKLSSIYSGRSEECG